MRISASIRYGSVVLISSRPNRDFSSLKRSSIAQRAILVFGEIRQEEVVLVVSVVTETDHAECSGRAPARPSLAVEGECDIHIDLLAVQVVKDVLKMLAFERDAVSPACLELFDDFEVSVGFDARDEPAAVGVDPVEQPEIVECEIEEDESARCLLAGGHLAVLVGRTVCSTPVSRKVR